MAQPETPSRYLRRLADVLAVQWTGGNEAEVARMLGTSCDGIGEWLGTAEKVVQFTTPAGLALCPLGWWIVRGEGRFEAVPDDEFTAGYEPA